MQQQKSLKVDLPEGIKVVTEVVMAVLAPPASPIVLTTSVTEGMNAVADQLAFNWAKSKLAHSGIALSVFGR
jgi:hypothetical protein